jgi:peptidoglycan/xylan/chitin deacetylase (PgdA/CDA1 family)
MMSRSIKHNVFIALLASCVALAGANVSIASVGDSEIATWKDNLGGALSLTIDDALDDREDTLAILDDFSVKGTFFLNTGALLARPSLQAAMIGASQNGHEIASHTLTHPDLTNLSDAALHSELSDSQQILEGLVGKAVISLAYPFGADDARVRTATAQYYLSGRDVWPDALHPATGQDMYRLGEAPGPSDWTDAEFIQERLNFATSAATTGGWAIEMYHNLGAPGTLNKGLYHTEAALRGHLTNLTTGSLAQELWVAPVGDVVQYYRSREGASLSTDFPGGDEMTVELTLTDPTGRIATNLTLSTTVPGAWAGQIAVVQNGQPLPFTESSAGADLNLQYNALPNGGDVLISFAAPTPDGDFNDDDIVDGADFLKWQLGDTPENGSQAELALWEAQYGGPPPLAAATAAVPEPTSLLLLQLAILTGIAGTRTRRKFS